MPLTKKQKQLRASIAHARTFRHLDSAAEQAETRCLLTQPPHHSEPEQLLEDYGGNSSPGTIEAVTRDAESQDEDDVIELQGEELVESLRCQMEAEITLERQLSKEGLEVLIRKIDAWEWQKAELK